MDNLSTRHYKAVLAEIQGRFFSPEEASQIKEIIDMHTIRDPAVRVVAAKAWESDLEEV